MADQTVGIMSTVVSQGTGVRAALGDGVFAAGKTGTTENSGDAWFVGFTQRMTVAVWVGYPNKLKPMLTEFQGGPVEGGTFPAIIWHDVHDGGATRSSTTAPRASARQEGPAAGRHDHDDAPRCPTTPPVPVEPVRRCPRAAARRRRPTPTQPATPPPSTPTPQTQSTPAQQQSPAPSSGTGGTGTSGGASAPPSP